MSIDVLYSNAVRPARHAGSVMVAVIAGPDAPLVPTAEKLRRWRRLTPLASWSAVPVCDAGPDEILHGIAAERARQGVGAPRPILLAEGKAARAALELVLRGALDCAGILAIDLPCAALPFPIVPIAAAIRLVLQCEEREGAPRDLITALNAADIDARIISLNPAAAKNMRTAANAAETFVLELVANASRQSRHRGV